MNTGRDDEELTFAFRIQFSTKVIAPKGLPDFAYVSTSLLFDCLIYTAIVREPNITAAVQSVQRNWPDAVIRFLEQGAEAFKAEDYYIKAVQYGSYLNRPKSSWFRHIFIRSHRD